MVTSDRASSDFGFVLFQRWILRCQNDGKSNCVWRTGDHVSVVEWHRPGNDQNQSYIQFGRCVVWRQTVLSDTTTMKLTITVRIISSFTSLKSWTRIGNTKLFRCTTPTDRVIMKITNGKGIRRVGPWRFGYWWLNDYRGRFYYPQVAW